MKTIVKVILPVLAFTLASAAAISTNETKTKDSKKTTAIVGFIQKTSPYDCEEVTIDCTTTNTLHACMSEESIPRQVWLKDEGNACNVPLYRIIE
jgi:hydrogenase maturation factor